MTGNMKGILQIGIFWIVDHPVNEQKSNMPSYLTCSGGPWVKQTLSSAHMIHPCFEGTAGYPFPS
jgi:hypothetical protein